MDFLFTQYPVVVPPLVSVVFLFSIAADFLGAKRRGIGTAVFMFGFLPLLGCFVALPRTTPVLTSTILSLIGYVGVFFLIRSLRREGSNDSSSDNK
jgi:hypothetical protein